jgi:hypothetical protein
MHFLVRTIRPESESLMKKRPCGRTKSHSSTTTTTATTTATTSPKIPLGKQVNLGKTLIAPFATLLEFIE